MLMRLGNTVFASSIKALPYHKRTPNGIFQPALGVVIVNPTVSTTSYSTMTARSNRLHHQRHHNAFAFKQEFIPLGTRFEQFRYLSSSSNNNSPFQNNNNNNRLMRGAGLLGAGAVLLGKSKYLLGALKLTKMASLGSMLVSIGTYSMFFGLPYSTGMVGLIMIHEAGHAAVMHARGIEFSPAVFVPFMGAVIAMKDHPRDAWEDALVAAGGPVMGSLGAAAVAVTAAATDSQLLYALADFGFMINLFNLLPLGSMDGGRIAGALSPYAGVVGVGLGGAMAYQGMIHNPIFYLILLSGAYETYQRFTYPPPPNYYKITVAQRAVLTTGYFGLVAALIAAMSINQRYRKPPEVLIRERELEKSWDMR